MKAFHDDFEDETVREAHPPVVASTTFDRKRPNATARGVPDVATATSSSTANGGVNQEKVFNSTWSDRFKEGLDVAGDKDAIKRQISASSTFGASSSTFGESSAFSASLAPSQEDVPADGAAALAKALASEPSGAGGEGKLSTSLQTGRRQRRWTATYTDPHGGGMSETARAAARAAAFHSHAGAPGAATVGNHCHNSAAAAAAVTATAMCAKPDVEPLWSSHAGVVATSRRATVGLGETVGGTSPKMLSPRHRTMNEPDPRSAAKNGTLTRPDRYGLSPNRSPGRTALRQAGGTGMPARPGAPEQLDAGIPGRGHGQSNGLGFTGHRAPPERRATMVESSGYEEYEHRHAALGRRSEPAPAPYKGDYSLGGKERHRGLVRGAAILRRGTMGDDPESATTSDFFPRDSSAVGASAVETSSSGSGNHQRHLRPLQIKKVFHLPEASGAVREGGGATGKLLPSVSPTSRTSGVAATPFTNPAAVARSRAEAEEAAASQAVSPLRRSNQIGGRARGDAAREGDPFRPSPVRLRAKFSTQPGEGSGAAAPPPLPARSPVWSPPPPIPLRSPVGSSGDSSVSVGDREHHSRRRPSATIGNIIGSIASRVPGGSGRRASREAEGGELMSPSRGSRFGRKAKGLFSSNAKGVDNFDTSGSSPRHPRFLSHPGRTKPGVDVMPGSRNHHATAPR